MQCVSPQATRHIAATGQRMKVTQGHKQWLHFGQSAPSSIVRPYLHQYMRKSMDLGYQFKDLNYY